MAAPTIESETDSTAYDTLQASKTAASISVNAGDRIVVTGTTEDNPYTISTPTDTQSNTYTLQAEVNTSGYGRSYAWSATAGSTGTITVTATGSSSKHWGFNRRCWGITGIPPIR